MASDLNTDSGLWPRSRSWNFAAQWLPTEQFMGGFHVKLKYFSYIKYLFIVLNDKICTDPFWWELGRYVTFWLGFCKRRRFSQSSQGKFTWFEKTLTNLWGKKNSKCGLRTGLEVQMSGTPLEADPFVLAWIPRFECWIRSVWQRTLEFWQGCLLEFVGLGRHLVAKSEKAF